MKLEGIGKTLLIPLWSRVKLSCENNPVIKDLKAIEIVGKIGYDFTKSLKSESACSRKLAGAVI
ncbi:MAG: hypothetical protein ABSG94_11955 [Brevinematales bacterium]